MNKHVILLSAAAVLLFSCSREVDQVILPGETITFTAAWAGADETRTILQSDGTSVWWDTAEQINVFFSDKASGKFTSTNSQSQAIVDFQGSLPIVVGSVETENAPHAYWAVYPYNAANTCDGESVTLTVPSIQAAKEGTFADKMFPSIATSTNFYLAFYNVCGGVRFTVANEGIASVTFKANNGESLTGKVKVGFDGVPVVESVVEGNSEVAVNAPAGGFVPGKYYFAALLPQTLMKGVNLTFKKVDGKVATTSLDNSITINRSRFGKMEEKDKGLEFKDDGSGHNPSDNIVFADSKVKERLVAKFDTNGDGELSYEEAAMVTSGYDLKAAFGAIKTYKSFDEFQYFTKITSMANSMFEDWNLLTSVILPPNLNSISPSSFKGCLKIESLVIPEGVLSIGGAAFQGCSSLVSVMLPTTLGSIGSYAFDGCSNLMSISIPESVSQIGQYSFNNCSSLSMIVVPDRVTRIEGYSFSGCTNLTSVTLYGRITSIDRAAFNECSSLVSINIPETVSSIGDSAFSGCSCLTNINIPNGVTIISNWLFAGCSNLTSIRIPESVTRIGDAAFVYCSSLNSVNIPESVSSIGDSAFSECLSLTSISIPESVTSISSAAFWGCSSLSGIRLPSSIATLGNNVFTGCAGLESIIVDVDNPVYDSRDNCNALIETSSNTLIYGCKNTVIPNSVLEIGYGAFLGINSLTSITIPNNVLRISDYVFSECVGLNEINISNGVTSIGASAFSGCSGLLEITFPASVTDVGDYVCDGCKGLTRITVLPETPPAGGNAMFSNTNNAPIFVPSESVQSYKTASGWSMYKNRIQAIQE